MSEEGRHPPALVGDTYVVVAGRHLDQPGIVVAPDGADPHV